jgi:omega-6 fatty acid desaturase (delta-12 desaturase)
MRTGKELLEASKEFASEDVLKSWIELLVTLFLMGLFLVATFMNPVLPLALRILCSIGCALIYVRMFVIYHDYQHRAILQKSTVARVIMQSVGIYLLAPETVWKRTHEHHHNNNSKLTMSGIGSYPTISKARFLTLTKKEQRLYLINRHPLTVLFGYFTLFIYWLNLKSFIESPAKHLDSLFALVFHFTVGSLIWYFSGATTFLLTWFFPFLIAFGIGSYLFYCQHNFPGAQFRENQDWKYDHAALASTSCMIMSPAMHWVTGNIAYHHVHHLNSRIPFYRLKTVMDTLPELKTVSTTSWNPVDMFNCFQLKLWDAEKKEMITMGQLKRSLEVQPAVAH